MRRDLEENLKLFHQSSPLNHLTLGQEERELASLKPRNVVNRERMSLTLHLSGQLSPAMKKKMRLQAIKDAENGMK